MKMITDVCIQLSLHPEIYILLSCIWLLGYCAYSHVMLLMKFAVCQMLPRVIDIVIYFTFQRSMIGNKTFGFGTSHNTKYSSFCYIKIN
jgi:hypothetical protein